MSLNVSVVWGLLWLKYYHSLSKSSAKVIVNLNTLKVYFIHNSTMGQDKHLCSKLVTLMPLLTCPIPSKCFQHMQQLKFQCSHNIWGTFWVNWHAQYLVINIKHATTQAHWVQLQYFGHILSQPWVNDATPVNHTMIWCHCSLYA